MHRPASRLAAPAPTAPTRGVAVSVRALSHDYETEAGALVVLDQVSLDIPRGGYVALTGPSGAGKTTLLSIIGGLERPQRGQVIVGDDDVGRLDGDRLAGYRRRTVGFVFQHFGLLDTLSALENVELAMTLSGAPRGARRRRARELLADVGLAARLSHRPAQLSGGERQRVAIARALANDPLLVLADEPTGNLDSRSAESVLLLLEQIVLDGRTVVVVTHDAAIAGRANERFALANGRLL